MELCKPQITVQEFDAASVKSYITELNHITDTYGGAQPIVVKVESYGGSVAGLSNLLDAIKTTPNPIITYTSGIACSAGAILFSCAAEKGNRIIGENARLMIHEIQAGAIGDVKDINDRVKFINELNDTWMGILAKSCGLSTRKDIKDLISRNAEGTELWLTAKNAILLGFADKVASVTMMPHVGYEIIVVEDDPKETTEPTVKPDKKKKKK